MAQQQTHTQMQGRVCLITGANSGIGKATALGLARMGATVVMVCRDRARGEEAQLAIERHSGNEAVDLYGQSKFALLLFTYELARGRVDQRAILREQRSQEVI